MLLGLATQLKLLSDSVEIIIAIISVRVIFFINYHVLEVSKYKQMR